MLQTFGQPKVKKYSSKNDRVWFGISSYNLMWSTSQWKLHIWDWY